MTASKQALRAAAWPAARPPVARTLGDLLLASTEASPDALAVVFPDARLTYAELLERAWGVARSLTALGVQPRQNVGILMANCPEFIVAFFGIALLGAVSVPINARYRAAELRFLVQDADLVAILTTERNGDYVDFVELLDQALPGLRAAPDPRALQLDNAPCLRSVVVFGARQSSCTLGQTAFDALAGQADDTALVRWCEGVALRSTAAIVYTSGTTSHPRGAMLTHEALVRAWMMVGLRWGIGPGDRFWDPCPLFHIAAIGPLIYTIGSGATFVTDTYFEPGRALKTIAQERPTMLYPTYPPITQALLGHADFGTTDFSAVKVWLNVAPPETLRQMAQAIPHAVQISTYGSTEGGPVTLHDPADSLEIRVSTCGHPLPGNEVVVVDPETGAALPPGVSGEIIYRGYNTFSGYYKDPGKTAASIDAAGWIHTGDRGHLDAHGRLTFLGRLKEMLKVGGENVAPAEIEEFLGTHPHVKLVQVVGIPDPRLVEVVAAFVELREGASVSDTELMDFCRRSIASFKVPRVVRIVTEWPLSATKIQRSVLRDRLVRELGL